MTANPYIGLRPYQESERSLFYGRDKDRKIFVDMVLANRLTLLFAASGVGKSSLLQAAVLPQLKDPAQENLDAVYCNNWAAEKPLQSIREATIKALCERGRIDDAAIPKELSEEPLCRFFEFCSHFVRQPLVLVLDQFEEFFHYHRGSAGFPTYRAQLVELISERSIPISLVISMREDFALSLNAFKPELPTVLFNNFYRLEKLPQSEAEAAIVNPAAQAGYSYEPELLQKLLTDLAARESVARPGTPVSDTTPHVEPPYLQIVCSQLFNLDRDDPEHKLRLDTYRKQGGARGLLSSYIDRVTADLSYPERQLASKCFSHLVTRRGTKVAHTADSLARELNVPVPRLEAVLKRLERARLLRSQSQDLRTWYELYHDLFSDSVEQWNERFKAGERLRRTLLAVSASVAGILALYAAYNIGINLRNYHLRLSIKAGPTGQVEIYRGQAKTLDPFGLQIYVAETGVVRKDIESDLLFDQKPIHERKALDTEWAERLPVLDRMRYYRERGEIAPAIQIARDRLNSGDEARAKSAIQQLTSFRMKRGYDEIAQSLKKQQNRILAQAFFSEFKYQHTTWSYAGQDESHIRREFSAALAERQSYALRDFLFDYLKDTSNPLLQEAAQCIGALEGNRALPRLIEAVRSDSSDVREDIGSALSKLDLDPDEMARQLASVFRGQTEKGQRQILELLAQLDGQESRRSLRALLRGAPASLRIAGLNALRGKWKNAELVEPFLDNPEFAVAVEAAAALAYPGSPAALQKIRQLRAQTKDAKVAARLEAALGRLDATRPEAHLQFAQHLREQWSNGVDYSGKCPANPDSLLAFNESGGILEQAMMNAKPALQRYILKCLPDAILATKVGFLSSLALSADPVSSSSAVLRLMAVSPEQGFATLLKMIESDSYDRQKAVFQIAKQQRSEKVYAMVSAMVLRRSASMDIRLKALAALGAESTFGIDPGPFRGPIATNLRQIIRERENSEFKVLGAVAMAAWLGEDALEDLRLLLNDSEKSVRTKAAEQLLALRSPKALRVLRQAIAQEGILRSDDFQIDAYFPLDQPALIRQKIEELKTELRTGGSTTGAEWRQSIRRILDQFAAAAPDDDLAWLKTALASSDRIVRDSAIDALSSMGTPQCRALLQKELSAGEESLRHNALLGFAKMARKDDIRILAEHLRRFPQDYRTSDKEIREIGLSFTYDLPGYSKWRRDNGVMDFDGGRSAKSALLKLDPEENLQSTWEQPSFPEIKQRISRNVSIQQRILTKNAFILQTDKWRLRRRAARIVSSISNPRANEILLKSLSDGDGDLDSEVAEALTVRNESRVIQPILRWLASERSAWYAEDFSTHLALLAPSQFAKSQPKFWPLLAARCEQPFRSRFHDVSYLTLDQRTAMAELLGKNEQPCSAELLTQLIKDPSLEVREAAAGALGVLEKRPLLAELHQLLRDPSVNVQRAAAESLSKVAGPGSLAAIREKVEDDQNTPLYVVVPLLYALGHIGTEEAAQVLMVAAVKYEDSIGRHAYRVLGDMRATQMVGQLWARLKVHEDQVRQWRGYRDRVVSDRNDTPEQALANKGPQRPDSFALIEMVTTLARLDAPEAVFSLLHHDLSDVRQAAALGLAVRGLPKVVLQLDALRADSQEPLFRHAAYRALDMSLEVIEELGNEADLQALRELRGQVRDQDGVLPRIDWTIDELARGIHEQTRTAEPAN